MEQLRSEMPRARTEKLIVEELPDETLVYDLKRHKAHCLNRTAAAVWRQCDGGTTVSQIVRSLEEELAIPNDEGIVTLALDRLKKARLLEEGTNVAGIAVGPSRRELVRKLAMVGGAILLPMVTSMASPTAAMAASSTTSGACKATCAGFGLPCSDRPGRTCGLQNNKCKCV